MSHQINLFDLKTLLLTYKMQNDFISGIYPWVFKIGSFLRLSWSCFYHVKFHGHQWWVSIDDSSLQPSNIEHLLIWMRFLIPPFLDTILKLNFISVFSRFLNNLFQPYFCEKLTGFSIIYWLLDQTVNYLIHKFNCVCSIFFSHLINIFSVFET